MDVPAVLLAGGLGTRLRGEADTRPKPMVEIGGKPILWHIMMHYGSFGVTEFVICLGYLGEAIKEYFLDYWAHRGSLTVDTATGQYSIHEGHNSENWRVHLLETGRDSMTGGRLRRAMRFVGPRRVMVTYGDGVSDVDVAALVRFHETSGRCGTLTAVRPPARFGGLVLADGAVRDFTEKPQVGEGWINGGFMVFEPGFVERLAGDDTVLEREPLEMLAADGELSAFRHDGFWQCMDTPRDLALLRSLWDRGDPPWRSWA